MPEIIEYESKPVEQTRNPGAVYWIVFALNLMVLLATWLMLIPFLLHWTNFKFDGFVTEMKLGCTQVLIGLCTAWYLGFGHVRVKKRFRHLLAWISFAAVAPPVFCLLFFLASLIGFFDAAYGR